MRPTSIFVFTAALLLGACTAQGEKVAKELENLPGVTCVMPEDGPTHCGPDRVPTGTPTY